MLIEYAYNDFPGPIDRKSLYAKKKNRGGLYIFEKHEHENIMKGNYEDFDKIDERMINFIEELKKKGLNPIIYWYSESDLDSDFDD